ncbi:MAG TPA: ATP-binding cassette domain-containing protein, partial [Bradyrhizobium sp.]
MGLPVDSRAAQPETGLVVADNVVIRFGDVDAAGPISFSVMGGEFISLLGPSGCGKSSLLRAIAGLIPVASGRLSIAGQPPGEAAAMRVGLMFQKPLLLPLRTTLQNIVLP